MCAKFRFKFQAVAEKTAKNVRGYFILPHPVVRDRKSTLSSNFGVLV